MSNPQSRQPAWQTEELQEEWVDLEPEESLDEGNNEDNDNDNYGTRSISLTAPLITHIIHSQSDLDAEQNTTNVGGTFLVREDVAHAPLVMPKTPGRNPKAAIKDFFTPLPLERMFDPPTPPNQEAGSLLSQEPPSPPQSAVLVDETEPDCVSDEILATDMPNMQSFHGRKRSLACQFTFSVPRNIASRLIPQAQSTPSAHGAHSSAAPPDSRLRLFQFQYDTYTREHLSAMVDSIAINTPTGSGTTTSTPSYAQHLSRVTEATGSAPDTSHLRSTKRIKLSPASEFYGEGIGAAAQLGRPSGKDYVGESQSLMEKIKQARDFSTISSVGDGNPLRPMGSTSGGSIVVHREEPETDLSRRPSYLSSQHATSSSNTLASKPNSYKSLQFRQNAMDLMQKIKSDVTSKKRTFSSETEISTIASQSDDSSESVNRSALASVVHRRKLAREEKENLGPNSNGHRRKLSSQSSTSRPRGSPKKVLSRAIPSEEMGEALADNLSRMSVSDRGTNTNTAAPASTERAPARRPPSSMVPAHPSSQIRGGPNEDLNRFVSSSTASGSTASGTTLTSGVGSMFVKHAGPPHLRTIAPTDLPTMPERMGDMLFDKVMMKWVKNSAQATQDPDKSGGSLADLSDDPFGDIESLDGDSRGGDAMPNAGELEPAEDQEGARAAVAEMSAIEERSEAEDDDEEFELTSFSTDASAHVVDIMAGVDNTGYNDGDDTTDSEYDEVFDGTVTRTRTAPVPMMDYESGEEDFSPPNEGYPQLVAATSAYLLNADMGLTPHLATPSKRNGGSVQATPTTIRSVLKSSGTPNSAMKSRSRYETPQNLRHRRSVSFSDGKRDGPMEGLDSSTETELPSQGGGRVHDKSAITQPSARTKRIADMMDALVNSDFDEAESPSKASSFGGRPEELRPLTERDLANSMPLTSQIQSDSSQVEPAPPRRKFSRSQTYRTSGGSNAKSYSRANGTFLTECSFGVAHDRLVEVITDVQPFEPHWEQLSGIDLSEKKLESVARLKEFLPKLDSLNLNDNQLSWLSGLPQSIRTLSVARNSLTGITSYNHLLNIENLDISDNEVESLRQLECLRHLRELKADNNKISSLDGLERLDGLVKLSVQGNTIQSVDLEVFRWTRLEMLNLSRNRLESVRGLSSLAGLIAVNLDDNSLKELDFGKQGMARLRILRVSGNGLSELKVSLLPNLRTLYADNNSLSGLAKVDRLTRLENLSLRNQSGRGFNLLTRDVRDVKRLYLSGNPLKAPILKEACYNLVYLELAACRLTSLPEGFGKLCPNVRVLNLNYNFLEDVRGLEDLTRMQKLTIIGSRLKSTKPLIRLVQRMPDVEMLDFRMNPCTLGWYLPLLIREGTEPAAGGWGELDAKFRRDLPDAGYVGRLAYRGLVMRGLGRLRVLDGVGVTSKERAKAGELLAGILGRRVP